MKIRLNAELGGHKTGDTIDVTPGVAETLIAQGYADGNQPEAEKPRRGRAKLETPDI